MQRFRRVPLAPAVLVLVALLFLLLCTLYPRLIALFVLRSDRPLGIWHATGLLTYPLAQVGLGSWAWTSALILVAGWFTKGRLRSREFIQLIAAGSILGGVAFILLEPDGRPFAGLAMVAWAFTGAAVLYGLAHWAELQLLARAFVGFFLLTLIVQAFYWESPMGAESIAAAVGATLCAYWSRGWSRRAELHDS